MTEQTKYDANSIDILENLEPVRLRPEMYIGDVDVYGLHHILKEVIDNTIDEYVDGHVSVIGVRIDTANNTATVVDNGRGIPVTIHSKAGIPTLTALFTKLHSGGKFREGGAYTGAGMGLHGVGIKATNALSESLRVWTRQGDKTFIQEFSRGEPLDKIKVAPQQIAAGTRIVFKPDAQIFGDIQFSPSKIKRQLRSIAQLCPGLIVHFRIDSEDTETFSYENGLADMLEEHTEELGLLHDPLFIEEEDCQIALVWTDKPGEKWVSYVNVSPTPDHGTHVAGARAAVQKVLLQYKETKMGKLRGDDIRDGLVAVLHARIIGPRFRGQTKFALTNKEATKTIGDITETHIKRFASSNTDIIKTILENAIEVRDAKKKLRDKQAAIRKVTKTGSKGMPKKLAEAPDCPADKRELYIVEGDSAFGPARDGRMSYKDDKRGERVQYQEIFPLRGKVLNVARKGDIEESLKNAELSGLVQALGTGIGPTFSLEKARHINVFLLMDADPDGKHIMALLLAFFIKYLPQLIEDGRLKVVLNPLYRGVTATETIYGNSPEEIREQLKGSDKNLRLSRFKGLGESNAKDLRVYAMDPKTRKILDVIWDGTKDRKLVLRYMGFDTTARKEILQIN